LNKQQLSVEIKSLSDASGSDPSIIRRLYSSTVTGVENRFHNDHEGRFHLTWARVPSKGEKNVDSCMTISFIACVEPQGCWKKGVYIKTGNCYQKTIGGSEVIST